MAKKTSLELASQGLDSAFLSLEKEIKGYKNILDVSPRTLNRLLKDKGKARQLRNELIEAVGHSYIGTEDSFIALTSTQKLNKSKRIIERYTKNTPTEFGTNELLATRPEARGKLFLKKSAQAGARLRSQVVNHIGNISKFTSPDLISKVKEHTGAKVASITLSLEAPGGRKYKKLEKQALDAMVRTATHDTNTDIQDILKSKKQLIEQTFLGVAARTRKIIDRKKRKKASTNRGAAAGLTYIEPTYGEEEDSDGTPKHLSVLATLQRVITETVEKRPHMWPGGAKRDKGYLRVQSHRFSRSVRIENVNPSITAIEYSYMEDPYSIFIPGRSTMSSEGRSPKNIIEGAVREIMQKYYTEERFYSVYNI